jgi:glycosyltransferase involved in cell wall biosynthesis
MSKKSILIYQPIIAPYQLAFFDELSVRDKKNCYTIRHSDSIGKQQGVASDLLRNRYSSNENISFQYMGCFEFGGICLGLVDPVTYQRDRQIYDIIVVGTNPYHLHNIIAACFARRYVTWGHFRIGKNCYSRFWYSSLRNKAALNIVYDENELPLIDTRLRKRTYAINNAIEYGLVEEKQILSKQLSPTFLFVGRITIKSELYSVIDPLAKLSNSGCLPNGFKIGIIGGSISDYIRFISLAREASVSSHFIYHGEIRDKDEINSISLNYCFGLYPGHIGLSAYTMLANGLPVVTFKSYDSSLSMPESLYLSQLNSFTPRKGESLQELLLRASSLTQSEYADMIIECMKVRIDRNIAQMASRLIYAIERSSC